jgi:competence ComEA-like helix-hairpin-helix protein
MSPTEDVARLPVDRSETAEATASTPADAEAYRGPIVDLNTATQRQLEGLPGIGRNLSRAIVAHRGSQGYFQQVDDLQTVHGIGARTLSGVRPYVRVSQVPESPPEHCRGSRYVTWDATRGVCVVSDYVRDRRGRGDLGRGIRLVFYGSSGGYSSEAEQRREEIIREYKRQFADRLTETQREDPNVWWWPFDESGQPRRSSPNRKTGAEDPTIDHDPPVARHWNDTGRRTSQQVRLDFYKFRSHRLEEENIVPRNENSSRGSKGAGYEDSVEEGFSGPGG